MAVTQTKGVWGGSSGGSTNTYKTTVVITAGTASDAFSIPGKVAFALISTTGSARTLTFQHLETDDETYMDSALTATTATDAEVTLTSNDFAPYAGLFDRPGMFKITLDGSDTVTVVIYSNDKY